MTQDELKLAVARAAIEYVVEGRKIGMQLEEWCREEDIEMRLTKPRLEPLAQTINHRHSL